MKKKYYDVIWKASWSCLHFADMPIKFGRKRSIDRNKLLSLIEKGVKGTALAKEMKISRAAVYKIIKEEKIATKYFN